MPKVSKRTRFSTKRQHDSGIALLIFKGVIASLIVSIVSILFLSLISLVNENTFIERYIQYLMVAVTMVSIFVGSVYATQKAESKGLIIGMAIGFIYVLFSVGLGMKLTHEPIIYLVLANKCLAGLAAGALGGLVGVNL